MTNLNSFAQFEINNQEAQNTQGGRRVVFFNVSTYTVQHFFVPNNAPTPATTQSVNLLSQPQQQDQTEIAYAVTSPFSEMLQAD